jgi:hypothetical protein
VGTGRFSSGGEQAPEWSWPLTSIQGQGLERWSYTSTPPHLFMT